MPTYTSEQLAAMAASNPDITVPDMDKPVKMGVKERARQQWKHSAGQAAAQRLISAGRLLTREGRRRRLLSARLRHVLSVFSADMVVLYENTTNDATGRRVRRLLEYMLEQVEGEK